MTDEDFAADLAAEAGRLLLDTRGRGLAGKALGAAGDHAANRLLCHAIRTHRPDDALLSEEEKDDTARCAHDRVWIVDPLDGTREYGEGRDDWAVHVGLSIRGVATLGAVALPARDLVLRSDRPPPPTAPPARPRIVVSRSRAPAEAVRVAAAIGGDLVPMGSAGAKAMAVVLGEADIYLHAGGQYEWDSCAPVAVALGHGLHASRLDGSPLRYNARDVYLPDLLICRPEWAVPVLAALASTRG